MKGLFLSLSLFLLSLNLSAQVATISGRVHLENGDPVSHVSIHVLGTRLTTVSNADGTYTLQQVPYGKQQVAVSSVEMVSQTLPLLVQQPLHHLDVHISPKGEVSLDAVAVTGKSVKQQIETSGFAVNVIETKDAAVRNIQTNELLNSTVGVRVLQSGGLGSEVQYNLNGMTGRSVGIFIDGIEMSTYGSSFNLNSIPPSMIERIEVYKGVLPAHLSGDLLGGAINIVLKKGVSQNNLTASVSYGSFQTKQADISGLYRHAKSGLTAKFSAFHSSTDNDYEIWGKFSKYVEPNGVVTRNYRTKRFYDGYRSNGGRFELGFTDVKWADVFMAAVNISDTYKEIQHGQTMGTPYMGRNSEAAAKVLSLNYLKRDLLIKGVDLSVNAVYSDRQTHILDTVPWAYNWDGQLRYDLNGNPIRRATGGQQGIALHNQIDRAIWNTRSAISYRFLDGHRLSVNHTFKRTDRRDEDLLNPSPLAALKSGNDVSNGVFSFNYEASTFNKKLTSNIFYKIYQQQLQKTTYRTNTVNGQAQLTKEQLSNSRNNSGFGLALAYQLMPQLTLMLSAERAVRLPDESEIFGNPEENVLENIAIKPEVSDNLNLGFRLGTFTWDQHSFSLSANSFWRNMKERIMPKANELLSSNEIELTQFVNLGLAQTLGFEGELSYRYKKDLSVLFNFSKFNSLFKQEFDPTTGQKMTYYNKQIPNEPFFTMNANVHYQLHNLIQKKSQLSLFYTAGYVAPFSTVWPDSDWFITPAQLAQNVGASYMFPSRKFIVSVDAKNIFNAELYDKFAVQKPGRAFYLKLNYTINTF